jgi:hypothetical protein
MPVSGRWIFSPLSWPPAGGNDPGDACIEATNSVPELEFYRRNWITINRADMTRTSTPESR